MTTDPGAPRSAKHRDAGHRDAGHLDEDAEALEDPVHSGDARHQHERHERQAAAQRPDPDAPGPVG